MPRIYLDNAATSFPKPECVYAGVDGYHRVLGASAGRGGSGSAVAAADIVRRCRLNLARLFNAESPDRFAFGLNGTDALNTAIHGLLRPGDHVVTTAAEHNSVLRPLRAQADLGVTVTIVDCDEQGSVSADGVRAAIRPSTRLVAVTHASNVTGAVQRVFEIAAVAKEAGSLMLLDAAQTAGHRPIDLATLPVDLMACPGHKGLVGPLGTGVLYVRPGVEAQLRPFRQGGTGTSSEEDHHPGMMPDRLEAGSLNLPGLVGLEASTRWLIDQKVDAIHRRENDLVTRLLEGLTSVPGLTAYGPRAKDRVGVVSVNLDGWVPHDLAALLDAEFGIEVRAGFHCAPLIHRRLGTSEAGGTLRFSVGAFTTPDEIDAAISALNRVAGST